MKPARLTARHRSYRLDPLRLAIAIESALPFSGGWGEARRKRKRLCRNAAAVAIAALNGDFVEHAWAVIWPKQRTQNDGSRVVLGSVRDNRKLAIELMTRAHGKTWRQMQACGFRCQRVTLTYANPREVVTDYLEAHMHGLPITPAMERAWRRFEKKRDAAQRPLDTALCAGRKTRRAA